VAILLSHPVQYFSPIFKELAARREIELTVIYCSLGGARAHFDSGFGRIVEWDLPLLDGYRHKLIPSFRPDKGGPFGYFAPAIFREVRAERYDAVVVFGWSSLTCWLAFVKAAFERVPLMLYGDSNVIYEQDKTGLKSRLREFLLHALFRKTSAFLISGALNRRFYARHRVPAANCFDVPFAIDNEFFGNSADEARRHRTALRARYGIAPDTLLILFSGKLAPHKRPQDILNAVARLQSEFPRLGAAFVGDGELRASLERSIHELNLRRTSLLGFRNQSELPAVYAAADLLVLPSSTDNKPLVANEAMACGLPVIASDRTGVWGPGDLVRDQENGFVYRCGDADALCRAIRKLASDPELRRRMGGRSREIIRDFSLERSADGIVKAVQFALRQSSKKPRSEFRPQVQENP
jgi:glycosyltransferase involved in cell wall biosynthesis